MEDFCNNLYPPNPKSNSLDKKPLKITLKKCDGDTEVQLSTTDGFWRRYGMGQEGLSSI